MWVARVARVALFGAQTVAVRDRPVRHPQMAETVTCSGFAAPIGIVLKFKDTCCRKLRRWRHSAGISKMTRLKRRLSSRYDGNKRFLSCFDSHSPEKDISRNKNFRANILGRYKTERAHFSSSHTYFSSTHRWLMCNPENLSRHSVSFPRSRGSDDCSRDCFGRLRHAIEREALRRQRHMDESGLGWSAVLR
jgi:hypothetical protein